jgi:REP element-mobilizing transposase RayT
MSQGYQIRNQSAAYFITLVAIEKADIFTRKHHRDIFMESLRYCQKNKGLEIYEWVIMSNHVHLFIRALDGNLSDVIRDLKRHTSKNILLAIQEGDEPRKEWLLEIFRKASQKHSRNNEFQLWTHNNHPIEVYSNEFIEQKVKYIHDNPVRAGIVEYPEEYLYSSARNYADRDGLIDVVKISFKWKTSS